MANVQIHFEFNQWQAAFACYREVVDIESDVVMIVSTHPHTSGYWVESKPDQFQVPPTDTVYQGMEVDALEERVRSGLAHNEQVQKGARKSKLTGLIT